MRITWKIFNNFSTWF